MCWKTALCYCSVWIANSVGLLNYKAFLLFLLYTFLACGVATAMLLRDVVRFFGALNLAGPPEDGGRWGAHASASMPLRCMCLQSHPFQACPANDNCK